MDRVFIIRALSLYVPLIACCVVWKWRSPSTLEATGALLATAWNLPALLALNVAAGAFGWWSFNVKGGVFLTVPVDLWLSWSVLWGAFAALLFRRTPLWMGAALAGAFDVVVMPVCSPAIMLGRQWFIGEIAGLFLCLLPALILARLTRDQLHVRWRAFLQFLCFSGVISVCVVFALLYGGNRVPLASFSPLRLQVTAQMLFVIVLPGLSALQEFATVGGGTPLPFDPPRKLVTTGIYSYIANPMQVCTVFLLFGLGIALRNIWLALAALLSVAYGMGLAHWDERRDLVRRFGKPFLVYRRHVRDWIPRWRPFVRRPARVYLSVDCHKCSETADILRALHPVGLEILPAEEHPNLQLRRMHYESHDRSIQASGIIAMARALEHVNLVWAMLGMALRLPLISGLMQAIVDVTGGSPFQVTRRECSTNLTSSTPD